MYRKCRGQKMNDYFPRRPRITRSVPASSANALPTEAGSISGLGKEAVAAIPDPIPNSTIAKIFRMKSYSPGT